MAKIEMMMPSMGESIFECTVLRWLVKEGDKVEVDDMILEVATDKIDTEIGSSFSGVIEKFLVQEGEQAVIGKPICVINTEEAEGNTSQPTVTAPSTESQPIEILEKEITAQIQQIVPEGPSSSRFYSPLVLTIAEKENISKTELDAIPGTGMDQRVTKQDILAYVESRKSAPQPSEVKPSKPAEVVIPYAGDTIVEMDRMRRMIADRMVESKRTAPHVTSFVECDVTVLSKWRDQVKKKFEAETGEKLTFTPLLVEAIIKALKKYPDMNVQVNGYQVIQKKNINIGMAVALPSGNLIVPVIHDADQYSLTGLTKVINDLARRARTNQLKPQELQGGTYTFSNIGSFGNIAGTPILVQPQVGILAFGSIRKMPAVLETPQGDVIAIRQKMILSHSYDHRIVDGSLGGMFVQSVGQFLEEFDADRSY